MFCIYNDNINNRILVADHEGNISQKPYNSGFASSLQSLQGIKALENYLAAREVDIDNTPPGEEEIDDEKKIDLLSWRMSTSYNFAADSIRLANLRSNIRSKIAKKLKHNIIQKTMI